VAILGTFAVLSIGIFSYPYVLSLLARGEMVSIPAGPAIIGTNNPDASDEEKPQWTAMLPAFKIGRFEVSNRQYSMCIRAGSCTPLYDPSMFASTADPDRPAVGVTAIQAAAYCRWVGQRLPTELEWERAARGPAGGEWPWGSAPLTTARANVQIVGDPIGSDPVNSHPDGASPEGVYNLVGNVWEWTASYEQDYANYQADVWDGEPSAKLAKTFLVQRGGGWESSFERVTRR